jgi:hypothetical protein
MEKAEISRAEVRELFAESDRQIAETSRQMAEARVEFDRKLAARAAEFDRDLAAQTAKFDRDLAAHAAEFDRDLAAQTAKFDRDLAAHAAEFDRDLASRTAKSDREMAELRADIENTNRNINGIADSNGLFAQEYFFNSLEKKLAFAGVHFDYADDTLGGRRKKRGSPTVQDQFDIVLINEEAVAVIEVKHRARVRDVDTLIDRKLKNFKSLYTVTYGSHKVYLGVAAMIFEDGVAEAAKTHGVGLLRQVGETVEEEGSWEVRAY